MTGDPETGPKTVPKTGPKTGQKTGPANGQIWLDPGTSAGFLVRDTNLAFGRALRRQMAQYGMTTGQYYFLRALWIEEGLSQRELSRRVGTTEPTTASALRLLERKGLVKRIRNRRDRRTINIYPTAKGRNLKNELLAHAIRINETAVAGLNAEEVAFARRILMEMKRNLDREDEAGAP